MAKPKVKTFDPNLRAALSAFRTAGRAQPLSMDVLGRMLGYSAGVISKYLGGVPEGDVPGLEAKIADALKAAARRRLSDVPPFETSVTRTIHATLELVRKTGGVALISGPAGIGKTVELGLYHRDHPTTLLVTLTRWRHDDRGLAALLFEEVETSGWDGQTSKSVFMIERLMSSQRMVILDNAHRLSGSGRAWLFDFYDATGCPVALVGNPEVLATIRRNDQHFSRIGIHQQVSIDKAQVADYARKMVDSIVPDPQPGLYALASAVAGESGHLRALRQQLLLMLDLAATNAMAGDQVRSFHAAHTKLVRDYDL